VGPPPWKVPHGLRRQRKWSNLFEGADLFLSTMLSLAFAALGLLCAGDVNDWARGQSLKPLSGWCLRRQC
jgi:hypothetical protein